LNTLQEHPRAATAGAILLGLSVVAILYLLSVINEPPENATSTQATVDEGQPASGEQYGAGQGDGTGPEEADDVQELPGIDDDQAATGERIEYDIDGDGITETLLLVRGEGESRPLDWYLIDNDATEPKVVFARKGVVRGEVTIDGPRIVETEAVYAAGDESCCPSQSKRTLYVWRDGSLVVLRVEAAPAGGPTP
jgi:hypothetical protein